jgi:integrase
VLVGPQSIFPASQRSKPGVELSSPRDDLGLAVANLGQHKMRNRHPVQIDVPLPAELRDIIAATPATGIKLWLLNGFGKPFTEDAFSHWFADMVVKAGLPSRCTPHGLRKRASTDLAESGATTKEIMSVTGHTTLKEVERYTRASERKLLAVEAIDKASRRNRKATPTP